MARDAKRSAINFVWSSMLPSGGVSTCRPLAQARDLVEAPWSCQCLQGVSGNRPRTCGSLKILSGGLSGSDFFEVERNRISQNACELTHSETERDRDRAEEQTRKSVRTDRDAVKNDTEK